jgi:hypothetical protein
MVDTYIIIIKNGNKYTQGKTLIHALLTKYTHDHDILNQDVNILRHYTIVNQTYMSYYVV